MKVIVTGAAGFIGANLVKSLNERGEVDVVAVDNLTKGEKFQNLVDCNISDYFDKLEFLDLVRRRAVARPDVIFHQGACSDTMLSDGRYMLENNFRYSVELLRWCQSEKIPLIYASSAAVYGGSERFVEDPAHERPLNVYGYSKLLFDQFVRREIDSLAAPIIGLRYFNVYGPYESHKGRMASVAFHHYHQFRNEGRVKLFERSHGFENGEQRRDFIHVDDVVAANVHFLNKPVSGVYNLGSGRAQSFNDVALAVVNTMRHLTGQEPVTLAQAHTAGFIEYIAFPEALRERYQPYTLADLTQLRKAGYDSESLMVEQGVARYVQWLSANQAQ